MPTMTNTDRIEKTILLRATKSRVWRALTDAGEFGQWFGVKFDGPFEVGKAMKGTITIKGYEGARVDIFIERLDAEDLFSYRWHPYAVDPNIDYSAEPTTLVEFRLEQAGDGVRLAVVESGFDRIPAHRRDEAIRMNDRGWSSQIENIRRHVSG
jgi:uncharacterized protein YndB with AHSA1/START domain